MGTVREHEKGRVFFWIGFSYTFDIYISLGIGLNYFLFFSTHLKKIPSLSQFSSLLSFALYLFLI